MSEKSPRTKSREGLEDPSRRKFLEAAVGVALFGGSYKISTLLSEPQSAQEPAKPTEHNPPPEKSKEVAAERLPERPRPHPALERRSLDSYTFLNVEHHPVSIRTGALAGERLSDLYASYLGIPSGSVVPERLHIDFKVNLAALWRQKFGFGAHGRTPEEERDYREKFLKKHKDLMDLAERLYSSYEPAHARTMSLSEYIAEVGHEVEESHEAFMRSMFALSDNSSFPRSRRFLIEKLGNRVDADMLLAYSLTELMPSADGETNIRMLGFLLPHAGADFLDRIPSVHDMDASFGPYQITPMLFAPLGRGSYAEEIERGLPANFKKPKSIDDVHGAKHHQVAYLVALENIAQFVEKLSDRDADHARRLFDHTDIGLLREEVTAVIAAAHHQPVAAHKMFNAFLKHTDAARPNPNAIKRLLEYVRNKGVRAYIDKALANYVYLSMRGERVVS
ncbi:MAG: hypothetical protein ACYC75_02850 [Minisyncoccota bacterium]